MASRTIAGSRVEEKTMIRTLRTLLLAGLGTLEVTEEKLRSAFEDLVKRGEITEKDARDLVATWTKRAIERREAFRNQMRELVREELKIAEVSREEFDALAELVARLERRSVPVDDASVRR
jgi:polyhydroxyalkanoate synthesis regulator phasin